MASIQGTENGEFIRGTKTDDSISSGGGNDFVTAGAGNDNVNAGYGDDLVFGGSGSDIINGGAGNDVLKGGNGDDTLNGGADDDILVGGWGADTFSWGATNFGGTTDVVTDFRLDQGDVLDLQNATVTSYSFGTEYDGPGDPKDLANSASVTDVMVTITDTTSGKESTIWLLDVAVGSQTEQDVIDYLDSLSGI
ncbi:MAG: calcium-binding protein [Pseudomonadota bacterium]